VVYFINKDHLGSITQLIKVDENGVPFVYAKFNYDPWGRMRNPNDWSQYETDYQLPLHFDILERGFTGHEHMSEFNLINMNGRVYDPVLGQFIQPDNYVQFPEYAGSYNKYSYALNNPLMFTDPSGEFIDAGLIGTLIGIYGLFQSSVSIIQTVRYYGLEAGLKLVAITGASYLVSGGIADAFGVEKLATEKLLSVECFSLYMASSITTGIIMSGITSGFQDYGWNTFLASTGGGLMSYGQAVSLSIYAGIYAKQTNPGKGNEETDKNSQYGYKEGDNDSKPMSDVDKSNIITINIALSKAIIELIKDNVVVIDMNKQSEFNAKDVNGTDMLLLTSDIDRPEVTLPPLNRVKQNEKDFIEKNSPLTPFSPDNKYYILTNWEPYKKASNLEAKKFDVRLHENVHIGLNSIGWPSCHGIDAVESVFKTFRKYFQKANF
jgi:RHS repeat-associated protein